MDYSPRFRLLPTREQRELLGWQRDTVRQVYNHALYRLNQLPEREGQTVRQRVWQVRDELPDWKTKWDEWSDVYSTVLQAAVERIYHSITGLAQLRDNGHKIGDLNWKRPREFQSFTYRQRGFELDKKSGPDGRGLLTLKKVRGETLEIRFDCTVTFLMTLTSNTPPSSKRRQGRGTPRSASNATNQTNQTPRTLTLTIRLGLTSAY